MVRLIIISIQIALTSKGNGFNSKRMLIRRIPLKMLSIKLVNQLYSGNVIQTRKCFLASSVYLFCISFAFHFLLAYVRAAIPILFIMDGVNKFVCCFFFLNQNAEVCV